MSNALPRVTFKGLEWFVDVRLREIRQVLNPHERMTLEEIDMLEDTTPCTCGELGGVCDCFVAEIHCLLDEITAAVEAVEG